MAHLVLLKANNSANGPAKAVPTSQEAQETSVQKLNYSCVIGNISSIIPADLVALGSPYNPHVQCAAQQVTLLIWWTMSHLRDDDIFKQLGTYVVNTQMTAGGEGHRTVEPC